MVCKDVLTFTCTALKDVTYETLHANIQTFFQAAIGTIA